MSKINFKRFIGKKFIDRYVCIFLKAVVPVKLLLETYSFNQHCSSGTAMSSYGSSKHCKMFVLSKPTFLCYVTTYRCRSGWGICCWGWLLFKLQAFCVKWKLFPALKWVKK